MTLVGEIQIAYSIVGRAYLQIQVQQFWQHPFHEYDFIVSIYLRQLEF